MKDRVTRHLKGRSPAPEGSIVGNGDLLAHFPEDLRQFIDQPHLDDNADGQVGVLMGGVDGPSHNEPDVSGLLKEQLGNPGGTVLFAGQAVERSSFSR